VKGLPQDVVDLAFNLVLAPDAHGPSAARSV
jgi:hypothetical protein